MSFTMRSLRPLLEVGLLLGASPFVMILEPLANQADAASPPVEPPCSQLPHAQEGGDTLSDEQKDLINGCIQGVPLQNLSNTGLPPAEMAPEPTPQTSTATAPEQAPQEGIVTTDPSVDFRAGNSSIFDSDATGSYREAQFETAVSDQPRLREGPLDQEYLQGFSDGLSSHRGITLSPEQLTDMRITESATQARVDIANQDARNFVETPLDDLQRMEVIDRDTRLGRFQTDDFDRGYMDAAEGRSSRWEDPTYRSGYVSHPLEAADNTPSPFGTEFHNRNDDAQAAKTTVDEPIPQADEAMLRELNLPTRARAENQEFWQDFRRSTNVEDRRGFTEQQQVEAFARASAEQKQTAGQSIGAYQDQDNEFTRSINELMRQGR